MEGWTWTRNTKLVFTRSQIDSKCLPEIVAWLSVDTSFIALTGTRSCTKSAKRGAILSAKRHLAGTAKLSHVLVQFLQLLDFRPGRQVQVLSSGALGVKIVALRSFPHFRGVLAGLVDGLNEIRSPKKAIGWKESHQRPFAADAIDGMEGKSAVGEVIAAIHTSKSELGIPPVLLQKIGRECPPAVNHALQKIVRCCMSDDGGSQRDPVTKSGDVRPGQIGHYYSDLVLARKKFDDLFLVFARSLLTLGCVEQKNLIIDSCDNFAVAG